MKKLKFAVIGCGNIAIKSSIPALINSEFSELIVCIDTDIAKGKTIGEKFDLPFENSLKTAFKKYNFDAVYISTPIGTHKDIVILAAENKKHILCEKSLALNLKEVEEMVSVCMRNKVALFEGFMYQFHSQHQFVKKLIGSGEIGQPVHFQAWFGFPPLNENDFRYNKELGGGALLDAGSYTVHAARHFFEAEPINCYSILEKEGHEVEMRGSALLNFGNSKTAHLVFGFNNMYQNKYVIWGTTGVITLERAFALPPDFRSTVILEKQGEKKEFSMEPCDHFLEEINFFALNFENKKNIEEWRSEVLNQKVILDKILNN